MSAVDLTGRVAIVTGSTAGLGARFAHVLAGAGATVIVTGRRTERLTEVVDSITGLGGTAHGVRLDVADASSIEECLTEVTERIGTPQILVNNAGIPDARRAHKMPLELVDAVLDTNIRGLHCLGDSSGWTRGLMMASVMGVLMGRKLIEKHGK